jgi:hypothetical protein
MIDFKLLAFPKDGEWFPLTWFQRRCPRPQIKRSKLNLGVA